MLVLFTLVTVGRVTGIRLILTKCMLVQLLHLREIQFVLFSLVVIEVVVGYFICVVIC